MSRWRASTAKWAPGGAGAAFGCSHLSQFSWSDFVEVNMQTVRAGPTASALEVTGAGTGVALSRSVARTPAAEVPEGRRGFSLVELLIVVALLGLIAALVVLPVNAYYQRARIEGVANEVRNFMMGAQTLALNTNSRVTVTLQQTAGQWAFTLEPAVPPAPGTAASAWSRRLELPGYVAVNGLWRGGGCDWPQNPAGSGTYQVVCDSISRTLDPITSVQLTAFVTLRLTHVSTVEGRLKPPQVWELRLAPLWSVTAMKVSH